MLPPRATPIALTSAALGQRRVTLRPESTDRRYSASVTLRKSCAWMRRRVSRPTNLREEDLEFNCVADGLTEPAGHVIGEVTRGSADYLRGARGPALQLLVVDEDHADAEDHRVGGVEVVVDEPAEDEVLGAEPSRARSSREAAHASCRIEGSVSTRYEIRMFW